MVDRGIRGRRRLGGSRGYCGGQRHAQYHGQRHQAGSSKSPVSLPSSHWRQRLAARCYSYQRALCREGSGGNPETWCVVNPIGMAGPSASTAERRPNEVTEQGLTTHLPGSEWRPKPSTKSAYWAGDSTCSVPRIVHVRGKDFSLISAS